MQESSNQFGSKSVKRLMKIHIVFYSMYGHIYKMAEAVAEGARQVQGAEVALYQVPELVPDNVLESTGAKAAKAAYAHVPIATVDDLAQADAIIFEFRPALATWPHRCATFSIKPGNCGCRDLWSER
jgi:hypothetical protein